jgi:hypothetical protein
MTAEEVKAWSLPPTHLDSFVYQAQKSGHAEHIYGDEGTFGPPPQMGFNIKHRINIGITGECDKGLTTGHGSYLPDAGGSDEFLRSPGAWSLSGRNDGDHHYNGVDGSDNSPANDEPSPGWSDNGQPSGAQLPPPPGEGFQPMYQHGQFVGWYTPEQVARSQTDFPSVLREVVNGPYYYGGEAGRRSILYEIGDIDSPF